MIFKELQLQGAYLIDPEPIEDQRGFFARTFCRKEFAAHGIDFQILQCNLSSNRFAGTLRGMHYQASPYEEAKMITCIKGAIYDVIIDLRPDSASYLQWETVDLSAGNRSSLFIPHGFAHGFQTLVDETEVFYQMSTYYHPESARGIRWDDPKFAIKWPDTNTRIISLKDKTYSGWEEYDED